MKGTQETGKNRQSILLQYDIGEAALKQEKESEVGSLKPPSVSLTKLEDLVEDDRPITGFVPRWQALHTLLFCLTEL